MRYKFLIPVVLSVAMMIGYSKSDTLDTFMPEGSKPNTTSISFQTKDNWGDEVADSQTRGAVANMDNFDNFGVFASYNAEGMQADASNFMNNQLVSRTKTDDVWSSWEYSPIKYWSNNPNDTYDFFAYAPYATESNSITTPVIEDGALKIDYTVPKTCADQIDLLVATPKKGFKPQADGGVEMEFNHALVKVEFSVEGDGSRKIESITLKDLATTGTLTSIDEAPYFSWENDSATAEFEVKAGVDLKDEALNSNATTETSLATDNGYLFMLPQDVSGKTVTVVTTDVEGNHKKSIDLLLPADTEWVAGKSYNYIINATTPSFHEIYPDVSNCYIVNQNPYRDIIITVPISEYISYFWDNYGANETEKAWANLPSGDLVAEVIWTEKPDPINANIFLNSVPLNSGKTTKSNVTNKTTTFTASTSTMVMKFLLSKNHANNNFTIGVRRKNDNPNKEYLWSWHIWVTDYDPYANGIFVGGNTWMDRNLGAYTETFTPNYDGGRLFYQWGRKDPLPISQCPKEGAVESIADAVNFPNKFYTHYSSGYDWCGSDTDWDEDRAYHWRDKKLSTIDVSAEGYDQKNKYDTRKSIFDPSPMGWMLPVSTNPETYGSPFEFINKSNSIWESTGAYIGRKFTDNNTSIFFPASGYRYNSNGFLQAEKVNGCYWCASPESVYGAYKFSVYSGDVSIASYRLSYGCFVRSIKEKE